MHAHVSPTHVGPSLTTNANGVVRGVGKTFDGWVLAVDHLHEEAICFTGVGVVAGVGSTAGWELLDGNIGDCESSGHQGGDSYKLGHHGKDKK